ncbi:MAG: cytidine deaminase [Clostridiales bacterium]|nr:cytidine deaminase [Clostridiales bacterium]
MPRRDKHNYYLDIADTVLQRGTCLRRNWGAIIVKNDEIISTGYAGAPRKRQNCIDIGYCLRQRLEIPRGQMYEMCRSVHAEVNAVISAPRRDMIGAALYLVGREAEDGSVIKGATSCPMCKRVIINAGIDTVIIRDEGDKFRIIDVQLWVDNDDSLMASLPQAGY